MPPKPTTTTSQPASQVHLIIAQGFDPNKYVNKNMNAEQVSQLKEVFDLFDYDHSGQISIEEILDVIKTLGLENEAKNIITIVQSSTSAEELDFKAFLEIFGQQETTTEATLQQIYDVFDPNGTNCFGPEDFERVCAQVGEVFTPQ